MSGSATVLLGSPIDDVTLEEAVDLIAEMVREGRSSGRSHQVATVNVDFVVNARHDPALLDIMQRTDLAVPDGMGVVWGAGLVGAPVRTRVAGVDLVPALAERAAAEGWRICLFGAATGVAEEAAAKLGASHPGAVVGLPAPLVAADGTMDEPALDAIRAVGADIVCVALGNPKQEKWIDRYGRSLGVPVLIGIGGSLDFLVGRTRRAPRWMQRFGLEWVHRALSEPRRLVGRYAKDVAVYGPDLVRQAWRGRPRGAVVVPPVHTTDGVRVVQLLGRTTWPRLRASVGDATAVRLDLAALTRLDNETVAAIVSLVRQQRRSGGSVEVVGLTPATRAAAERARITGLLGGGGPATSGIDGPRQP